MRRGWGNPARDDGGQNRSHNTVAGKDRAVNAKVIKKAEETGLSHY